MLRRDGVEIAEERSARRAPLSDAEARLLLAAADEVLVARGTTVRTLPAAEATLDDLRGPTGGFRAPLLRRGRRLLVGFHAEALAQFLD